MRCLRGYTDAIRKGEYGMFEKIKSHFTWLSIAYVIMGLILLLWPATSMLVICRGFGVVLLLFGVIKLAINGWASRNEWVAYSEVSSCVIAALLGLLLLIRPQMFIAILPMLLGMLITVDGVMRLQSVLALRRARYGRWWLALISAAVTLMLGVLLMINPFEGMAMAVAVMGAFLLADGIANLFDILYLSRKLK